MKNIIDAPEQPRIVSGEIKASGVCTYTPEDIKCDTEDSGAFWDFSIEGYAKCSNCEMSFEALPTPYMFELNNLYCRHCGKRMIHNILEDNKYEM